MTDEPAVKRRGRPPKDKKLFALPPSQPLDEAAYEAMRKANEQWEQETKLPDLSPAEKHAGGRPTKYRTEYAAIAKRLTQMLGSTDREVAAFIGIDDATLYRWKHTHPEFCEALKTGKDVSDDRVEHSLYRRAVGYSHDAVKIFQGGEDGPVIVPYTEHFPPDTTAAIFWLKNRRANEWRDRVEKDIRSLVMVQVDQMTPEEREQRALALAQKAAQLIEHDG